MMISEWILDPSPDLEPSPSLTDNVVVAVLFADSSARMKIVGNSEEKRQIWQRIGREEANDEKR